MKTLTIRLGLEPGDTSMDDTIEASVDFEVAPQDIRHADNVVMTWADDTMPLEILSDIDDLVDKHKVELIRVIDVRMPSACGQFTDYDVDRLNELTFGSYTPEQLKRLYVKLKRMGSENRDINYDVTEACESFCKKHNFTFDEERIPRGAEEYLPNTFKITTHDRSIVITITEELSKDEGVVG